jgi:hypothetical protein
MPRTNRPPAYRLHRAPKGAAVTVEGKNNSLRPYGPTEPDEVRSVRTELIAGLSPGEDKPRASSWGRNR